MLSKILKVLGLKNEKGVISKKSIAEYLSDNPIIIEAGASDGQDTLELSKQFPNGQIHAFEPIPAVFEKLKNRVGNCKNVHIYPHALGPTNHTAKMYVSSGRSYGSSSLLKPKEHLTIHKDVHFKEEIEVPVLTIDDWAAKHNIDRVDFMWLDMQGAEYATLKASSKILNSLKVLYTEVSLMEMYEGVPLYEEYKTWLESLGFKAAIEEIPWKDMGNVLFVK